MKEFVQLLNHFPDLQTLVCDGSEGKGSADDGREILVCFADYDESNEPSMSSEDEAAQSSSNEICMTSHNFTDDSEFKFHAQRDSASSSNDADSESSSHCDVVRQDKSRLRRALECLNARVFFGFFFVASALLAAALDRSKLK